MPFVDEILKYGSVSITGMSKNSGKTEALNYILRRLPAEGFRPAVTSIGVDGERCDMVAGNSKPEITLRENVLFGTVEKFYRNRRLGAELMCVSDERTSLGRIVTGLVHSEGKVMLAGSGSTTGIKRWMETARELGADIIIIDGALSRKSVASPVVSEAMVLCTGAAFSGDMNTLVRHTAYMVGLIRLPLAESVVRNVFSERKRGVWGLRKDGTQVCMSDTSPLTMENSEPTFWDGLSAVYVAGALTDRFLDLYMNRADPDGCTLVAEDFSRIFVSPMLYGKFVKSGGRITVMRRTKPIAVCANPVSPNGTVMDSERLCGRLAEAADIPVYDLFRLQPI